jgi:hypothetical protein
MVPDHLGHDVDRDPGQEHGGDGEVAQIVEPARVDTGPLARVAPVLPHVGRIRRGDELRAEHEAVIRVGVPEPLTLESLPVPVGFEGLHGLGLQGERAAALGRLGLAEDRLPRLRLDPYEGPFDPPVRTVQVDIGRPEPQELTLARAGQAGNFPERN